MNEDQNVGQSPDSTQRSGQSKMPVSSSMLALGGIAVMVALGGIALFANRGSNPSNSSAQVTNTAQGETSIAENQNATDAPGASEGTQEISIEAGSYFYKPAEIRVKKGQKVKITMTSKDMMHDFNIDELGVKIAITKSGGSNVVEFTPSMTGTFEYYCSVGEHRKMGQVGKIIVEE